MCRTNGLKKLYERELTMQSKYYGVFDALLRNFREAEAAEELNIGTADFQRMGKLILSEERLYKDFRTDMVPLLRNGAAHLGYLLGEQKHKETIIKVYDKIVCGLTVRGIVDRLSVSQHTIQQCRVIAVNELACLYELKHLFVRVNDESNALD